MSLAERIARMFGMDPEEVQTEMNRIIKETGRDDKAYLWQQLTDGKGSGKPHGSQESQPHEQEDRRRAAFGEDA